MNLNQTLKEFVRSNSLLLQKPIFAAKFWAQLIKITELFFGQIFDGSISLGNFTAVKILVGALLATIYALSTNI